MLKAEPLVDEDLSEHLSRQAQIRVSDPEYLAELQERCKQNSKLGHAAVIEMSAAGKQKLAQRNTERNEAYLKTVASSAEAIVADSGFALDVRRRMGMSHKTVIGLTQRGLASYDAEAAKERRKKRAAEAIRAKAIERAEKVKPLLETTRSAAEMCRIAGISLRTYKNWIASGLITRHPNGRLYKDLAPSVAHMKTL